jgi:hypothetical protein
MVQRGRVRMPAEEPRPLRLVYLVHDLGDPAVARRLAMLGGQLGTAVVIGFHRAATAPAEVAGWPAIALGRTADARLGRRAMSVLGAMARLRRLRPYLLGADVIMARQLEMLALAHTARRRFAPGAVLAYECLDIHNLMVAATPVGTALRRLEGWLLRATDLLVVSSPGFLREYFRPVHGAALPPSCVIENKVLAQEYGAETVAPRPAGPPWRIGWYGVLRCRRSLLLLAELAAALPGQLRIELRGRPARSAIPDFDALVAAAPGLEFLGPYDRRTDLAAIYQAVHFTWAIDFHEAGGNSSWLLPNRLYEGGLHGAVPIALAAVETGRWLAARHAGVLLAEPLGPALAAYIGGLDQAGQAAAAAQVAAVPQAAWLDAGADGLALAAALRHPARLGLG